MTDGISFAYGIVAVLAFTWLYSLIFSRITLTPSYARGITNFLSLVSTAFLFGIQGGTDGVAFAFGRFAIPQLIVFAVMSKRDKKLSETPRGMPPTSLAVEDDQASTVPSFRPEGEEEDMTTAKSEVRAKTMRWNIVARHWRGELSLATSYWGINILAGIASIGLVFILSALFSVNEGYRPKAIFAYDAALWGILAAIGVWQLVGLWRSANRKIDERRKIGQLARWAGLAKLMAILGMLQYAGLYARSAVPQLNELYKMAFLGDPEIPQYKLRLLDGGKELSLNGGIKYGVASDFRNILAAAPDVRTVHLESPGGRIAEAKILYQIIRGRGLNTYVSGECDSACTLVFAAGRGRWLLDGARLGYHSGSFAGLNETDLKSINSDWAAIFRKSGMTAEFVLKALAVPPSSMWYPTNSELVAAGAVTNVTEGGAFALDGHEAGPTIEVLAAELKKKSPIFGALETIDPIKAKALYAKLRSITLSREPAERKKAETAAAVRSTIGGAVRKKLPTASDILLARYAILLSDQYAAIGSKDPETCYRYAAVGNVEVSSMLPAQLIQRELALDAEILESQKSGRTFKGNDSDLWTMAFSGVTASQAALLSSSAGGVSPSQYPEYCTAAIQVFRNIGQLPEAYAAQLMRDVLGH